MAVWLTGIGAMVGLGAALGGYALLYEPFDVRAERLAVRLTRDRPGLPSEGCAFSIFPIPIFAAQTAVNTPRSSRCGAPPPMNRSICSFTRAISYTTTTDWKTFWR